ncbi:MAG: DUF1573 domain-containing protein [Oligoflexia bacterium]|nr:DUF1573 domain-containing protein [Oligoflexia bacterium]
MQGQVGKCGSSCLVERKKGQISFEFLAHIADGVSRSANICRALLALLLVGPEVSLAESVPPKPQLKIEEPVFDFGTVVQGTTVTHEFAIKNLGDGELDIQRVAPACGCTAATVDGNSLAPGQQGRVRVELDTADFSGEKIKLVRLFTNDPENPSSTITIKGVIQQNVTIDPMRAYFGELSRGAGQGWEPKEISIKPKAGSGITIDEVKSLSDYIKLDVLQKKPDAWRIKVGIKDSVPLGEFRERLVVNLRDSNGAFSLNIPVFAVVRGALKLSPPTLSVGVIDGTAPIERFVKLDNGGAQGVSVTSIDSNSEAVKADLRVVEAGKRFVVHVSVDPSKVSRDLRAAITIATNKKDEPPLVLNVYGVLPPK